MNNKDKNNKIKYMLNLASFSTKPSSHFKRSLRKDLKNSFERSQNNMNKKHFKRLSILAVAAVFVILTTVGFIINLKKDTPQNQVAQNDSAKTIQSSDTDEVNKFINLIEKQFTDMNNGSNYSQLSAYISDNVSTDTVRNAEKSSYEQIQQILNDPESNKKIFYTEKEIFINDPDKFGFVVDPTQPPVYGKLPGVDYTHTFKIQNWYNINYSKYLLMQNDKIINMVIITPKYNLVYAFGDFAIKTQYSDTSNYEGLTTYNPEISLISSILSQKSTSSYKFQGTENVDGKDLKVYQLAFDGGIFAPAGMDNSGDPIIAAKIKERFYVDYSNNSIYKREHYIDDKLIETDILKDSKVISSQNNLEDIVNYKDLKNIQIQTVNKDTTDENTYTSARIKKETVECMKYVKIFYISSAPHDESTCTLQAPSPNLSHAFNSLQSDDPKYNVGSYSVGKNLIESIDNPYSKVEGYYTGEIWSAKPLVKSDYKYSVESNENIKIKIHDKFYDANYITMKAKSANTDGTLIMYYKILFQDPESGLWYFLYEFTDSPALPKYIIKKDIEIKNY